MQNDRAYLTSADNDDDFSELDASTLDFLHNLDLQVNGTLRATDNDLKTTPGEHSC